MDDRFTQPDDTMPESLRGDLKALYGRSVPVGPEVDAAILALVRRRRVAWPWMMMGAAAVLAGAAGVAMWAHAGNAGAHSGAPVAVAEIARTGDIRDAFFLARQIKAGATPGPRWDVNGDGVVDQRDVDALAMDAVSLKRGTLQ